MFRILYVLGWFFFWVCRDMAWKLIVGWICCQILKFDRFHYLPFVKVLLQILHHIACSTGSNWTFANLVQLSLFPCDFLGQCWFTFHLNALWEIFAFNYLLTNSVLIESLQHGILLLWQKKSMLIKMWAAAMRHDLQCLVFFIFFFELIVFTFSAHTMVGYKNYAAVTILPFLDILVSSLNATCILYDKS